MEIPVFLPNRPNTKESLRVTKTLSDGKQKVLQVFSPSAQQTYALKLFPKNLYGASQYKKEKLMYKLNHSNVIQRIPMVCCDERFFATLTEFAKYGDFFDIVTKGHLNSETLIRTYFHQLIEGIEYIHSQGVAHLDLKLENIMLGADFQLKIIDFDQAQMMTDKIITSGGTVAYRAPEVMNGTCSHFTAADVYSAGVILYAFKAREFPFVENIADPDFKDHRSYFTFTRNNKNFWRMKAQVKKDKNLFNEDFIQLLNGMLHENPSQRPSIQEIKESRWYKGPVLDKHSLAYEMRFKLEPNLSMSLIKKKPEKLKIESKLPLIITPRTPKGVLETPITPKRALLETPITSKSLLEISGTSKRGIETPRTPRKILEISLNSKRGFETPITPKSFLDISGTSKRGIETPRTPKKILEISGILKRVQEIQKTPKNILITC